MKELYFKFLGPISLKNSNGEYEEIIMEKQPLLLLAYLLFNHKNKVAKETLFEAFWSKSTNPENAIKFGIFRLRKALEKIPELSDKNFIISSNGYYYINKDYKIYLDVEDFNSILTSAKVNNDFNLYKEVIETYNGDFLYGLEFDYIKPYRTYYLDQFCDVAEFLSERYLHYMKYQECIEVCNKALKFRPFSEKIILTFFEALIKLGKTDEIDDIYEGILRQARKRKYNSLLINKDTIADLINNCSTNIVIDIKDNDTAYGPYLVDKHNFLSIMESDRRLMNRYGLSFYLFDFELVSDEVSISDFLNVVSLTLRSTDTIYADKNHIYSISALKKSGDHEFLYSRIIVGMSLKYNKDSFKIKYTYRPL